MTLTEFKAYLITIAEQADRVEAKFPGSGADNLSAQMWKDFTPAALDLWTTPGVLEHIAACLAPPEEDPDGETEE